MFEDDDDDVDDDDSDYKLSDIELWYDNNFSYFYYDMDKAPGPTLEAQLFYYSVYAPFMSDLKKPIRDLIDHHYHFIATECRPEVLAKIDEEAKWVGSEFLMQLYQMIQLGKSGKDLRETFPKLDKWAIAYPSYRKPSYMDPSFLDKFDDITEEDKLKIIEESRIDEDEQFEISDKPRFEFFSLLQSLTFKYYKEVQDMDSDGWTLFEVFLFNEYTNYELNFEHYEAFIDYGFGVEDLELPFAEYSEMLSERIKKRWNDELPVKLEEAEEKKLKGEE